MKLITMRNNYISDMFKIPLVHIELNNWEYKKQSLLNLKKYDSVPDIKTENLITDFYQNFDNKYNYTKEVFFILENDIKSFLLKFNLPQYKITDAWFEKTYDNMSHQVHNHGSIGYSAVCFIKFNPSVHKPTHFISPFNDFTTGSQQIFVPEKIKEGSLILFPSVIHHYTVPSCSNEERIILSFNLK